MRLIASANTNIKDLDNGLFSQFVGTLDNEFVTDDTKYNEIIKQDIKVVSSKQFCEEYIK